MRTFLYFWAKFIGFFIYRFFFHIKVKGKENIPKKGGFIIAANHLSFIDPPTIGFICPRKLFYLAKSSLFKIKILSELIKLLGAIPVERETFVSVTLRKGIEILKNGYGLVIFPEGTRSINGLLKEGKPGVGFLAIKANVPVIPVRLIGTDKALPHKSKFIKFANIKVIIGKPLCFKNENYSKIGKIVMEEIKKLKW